MSIIIDNWNYLMSGLIATMQIFIISLLLGSIIGALLGVIRTSSNILISILSKILIEVFRGLPTLVTMFFVFFALPILFNINISSMLSAIIALTLWALSEISEIVRGAIQSIPVGQRIAGKALALTNIQVITYIIIPQAVKRMLPPIIGVYTRLIKGTSLAAIIGVNDFVMRGKVVIERTMAPLEIYSFIMIVFFIICFPMSRLSAKLEKNLTKGVG